MNKSIGLLTILFTSIILQANEVITLSAISESIGTSIAEKVLFEAYKRINIELEVKHYPAIRALQYSNSGFTDGEVNRIDGIETQYPNLIKVPVPIGHIDAMIFTKNTDFIPLGWNSLEGYKVGIRRGTKFAEQGIKDVLNIKPFITNSEVQLFQLINSDRVDLIVTPRVSGLRMFQDHGITGIYALEPPLESYPLYHYLHKKNIHLLPEITRVLVEMENEGLIEKIRIDFLTDYFGSLYNPPLLVE